jgi:hypothetical protein
VETGATRLGMVRTGGLHKLRSALRKEHRLCAEHSRQCRIQEAMQLQWHATRPLETHETVTTCDTQQRPTVFTRAYCSDHAPWTRYTRSMIFEPPYMTEDATETTTAYAVKPGSSYNLMSSDLV